MVESSKGTGVSLYGLYMVSIAACLAGNLAIRINERMQFLPDWGPTAVAVGSVLPLFLAAIWFWRMLASELDEMLQRIVLEGLGFAVILYVPLAGLYVNLRTAGIWTPRLDPPDILLIPAVLVGIGIAIASRRYS